MTRWRFRNSGSTSEPIRIRNWPIMPSIGSARFSTRRGST